MPIDKQANNTTARGNETTSKFRCLFFLHSTPDFATSRSIVLTDMFNKLHRLDYKTS
ncbi:MAG: hypothetical protein IKY79_01570 [Bacteroidales bacterium]|nr:hypothetical protein [Bacteroidales bacterium]